MNITWHCEWIVHKYHGDPSITRPYETIEGSGNLLLIGGASALWDFLIAGGSVANAFDEAHAHIGIGDSNVLASVSQTDLQASSNKFYSPMDADYPAHTDSTSSPAAKSITFKTTVGTSDANYAWNEWGIFNDSVAGRMLNRKVISLGTKTNSETWSLTVSITIA